MPAPSAFEIGQENLFTIYEMAPGEGGIPGIGTAGAGLGSEDYTFTDDFDSGGAEYGVDENVLDLSEAEAEGFGSSSQPSGMYESADDFDFGATGMGGMAGDTEIGPDDFELDLSEMSGGSAFNTGDFDSEDTLTPEIDMEMPDISPEPAEAEEEISLDILPDEDIETAEAPASTNMDFSGGGFDSEIEGLGFGFDEPSETEEISLEENQEPETDISLEPELDMADEEPSLELSEETEIVMDEEPSLELSEEPDIAMDEEPSLELTDDLELPEEPSLEAAMEESDEYEVDDGGIDFDLDSVDLDQPEEVTYEEEPAAETLMEEEPSFELEGLELEMETEEPEEEDPDRQ
ncbi:MAG: hypothetical protein OEZ51_02120 [Nitrospinota bacterium]|nr:hypothetical protein [Nitrospinota bacterium]